MVNKSYIIFDKRRKEYEAVEANKEVFEELKKLEQEIKQKKKEYANAKINTHCQMNKPLLPTA